MKIVLLKALSEDLKEGAEIDVSNEVGRDLIREGRGEEVEQKEGSKKIDLFDEVLEKSNQLSPEQKCELIMAIFMTLPEDADTPLTIKSEPDTTEESKVEEKPAEEPKIEEKPVKEKKPATKKPAAKKTTTAKKTTPSK